MKNSDSKNYLEIFANSLVDLENLTSYSPLVERDGKTACIRGELSLLHANLCDDADRLVEQIVSSCHGGATVGGFKGTPGTRILILDTVHGVPSIAKCRDNIKAMGATATPDTLKIASLQGCDPADTLNLLDSVLAEENLDVVIINNFSALVKSESYRECHGALTRLSSLAGAHNVSIVLVASPGFKLSLTKPSRIASLFMRYCPHIITPSQPKATDEAIVTPESSCAPILKDDVIKKEDILKDESATPSLPSDHENIARIYRKAKLRKIGSNRKLKKFIKRELSAKRSSSATPASIKHTIS